MAWGFWTGGWCMIKMTQRSFPVCQSVTLKCNLPIWGQRDAPVRKPTCWCHVVRHGTPCTERSLSTLAFASSGSCQVLMHPSVHYSVWCFDPFEKLLRGQLVGCACLYKYSQLQCWYFGAGNVFISVTLRTCPKRTGRHRFFSHSKI